MGSGNIGAGRNAKKTFRQWWLDTTTRLFPERQIMLRTDGRVSYAVVSRRLQMGLAGAAFALCGWSGYATVNYFLHDSVIASKDEAIANARLAYGGLLSEVSSYQQRFTKLAGELEENHVLMLRLVEQNATLQQNLKTVENELDDTKSARQQVADAREQLKRRLFEIEGDMRELASRNFLLEDNLAETEKSLHAVIAERDAARNRGLQLSGRVVDLERTMVELQEAEKEVLQRLTDLTAERIESIEGVIAATGLDVDNLLAANDAVIGQGGPFVAANLDDNRSGGSLKSALNTLDEHLSRWNELQRLMGQIPMVAPMDYYYISSNYGKRRDPLNKQLAMHHGLDLGGPVGAPVYATAPGKVIFAGWKGNYGKLIEIDHGAGIITRYAHLNKIEVKKGEVVETRTRIGQLGNTGRSTGPHLHYEVHVEGKTRNPLTFIKAGHNVFKG